MRIPKQFQTNPAHSMWADIDQEPNIEEVCLRSWLTSGDAKDAIPFNAQAASELTADIDEYARLGFDDGVNHGAFECYPLTCRNMGCLASCHILLHEDGTATLNPSPDMAHPLKYDQCKENQLADRQ